METDVALAKPKTSQSHVEFVVIISVMMSLTALAIDAMLPALSQIDADLRIASPNDRQLVISLIFFGQAIGQLFFGPLSDRTGRKPAVFLGYLTFTVGSLLSMVSVNLTMMLAGRALQGIGVSAPRAISMAMVRDRFKGRQMASIMSFAMTVFILVPIIAPSIGQAILSLAGWRSIFGSFIFFALISLFWFAFRMPETLAQENRTPFTLKRIVNSIREVLSVRATVGYTLAAGLVYGIFIGYLNSSQQIFQEQYDLGDLFSLYFALIAFSMGGASFLNGRLVMRYGMVKLIRLALGFLFGQATLFFIFALTIDGDPSLWVFTVFLMLSFFCVGLLFGNINSLAMEPVGRRAGTGAAVVGSFTTLISMLLGTVIGRSYNETVIPLVVGMAILAGVANVVVRWAASEE